MKDVTLEAILAGLRAIPVQRFRNLVPDDKSALYPHTGYVEVARRSYRQKEDQLVATYKLKNGQNVIVTYTIT